MKKYGALVATTRASGQQWDCPNVWTPHVGLVVDGFRGLEEAFKGCGAGEMVGEIAKGMICAMYAGWKHSGDMHEKYEAGEDGKAGGGGEYEVQEGFGWSNGVALRLRELYRVEIDENEGMCLG